MAYPLRFRVAFSTPWFEIEESEREYPGEAPYYRMTGPDGIICLPLTPTGDIVAIRQFRPALGRDTLEIPAGSIDQNEAAHAASIRELAEETGYRCGFMRSLAVGRLYLNRCTQLEYFFLGLDAVQISEPQEAGITPIILTRRDFRAMIDCGEIEQAAIMVIMGYALAVLNVDLLLDPIEKIRAAAQKAPKG